MTRPVPSFVAGPGAFSLVRFVMLVLGFVGGLTGLLLADDSPGPAPKRIPVTRVIPAENVQTNVQAEHQTDVARSPVRFYYRRPPDDALQSESREMRVRSPEPLRSETGVPVGKPIRTGPLPATGIEERPIPPLMEIRPAVADGAVNDVRGMVNRVDASAPAPAEPISEFSRSPVLAVHAQVPAPPEEEERLTLPGIPSVAPEPIEVSIPLAGGDVDGKVKLSMDQGRISLVAREAPINVVLGLMAQQNGLNVVTAENVNGTISVTLNDVSLSAALNAILRVNGYAWTRQEDIIVISKLTKDSLTPPATQGRQLRVFSLNFLAAADADTVVKGLLSPVGNSFITETNPIDQKRTREQLIVEDLPDYLERIEQYLLQADHPPRQVLIEAHILQIDLRDEMRHGVDIQNLLARVDTSRITLNTAGFTNPAESPAFFLGVDGTDLELLVEAIQTTTDSKTLAAPKVLVVNGQEAKMQIGAKLGFLVTTTTQTSTLQDVQFLEVGVVLRVTPHITQDQRILMSVKPQVSTGEINLITGLPEEETTEVETTVMLQDGKGMIIGGLIQETDTINQNKIPIVGDLWLVGRLFQRRSTLRRRSEIVIALVPRLVPYTPAFSADQDQALVRATSPLLGPELERIDRRPVEPELSDAVRNPRSWELKRIPHFFHNLWDLYPHPMTYYFPSADERGPYRGFVPRDPEIQGGHSLAPGGEGPYLLPPMPSAGSE
jgi:type IV pilus assembly protein PilQ